MNKLLTMIVLGFFALAVLSALGFFALVGVVTPTRVTKGPAPAPTVLTGSAPANAVTHDGLMVQASNLRRISGQGLEPIAPGVWGSPWHDDYDASRLLLTDLGSSNGSFMRLREETEIKSGDVLLMGQQLFRVAV